MNQKKKNCIDHYLNKHNFMYLQTGLLLEKYKVPYMTQKWTESDPIQVSWEIYEIHQ